MDQRVAVRTRGQADRRRGTAQTGHVMPAGPDYWPVPPPQSTGPREEQVLQEPLAWPVEPDER
jgi:hypothetical protein